MTKKLDPNKLFANSRKEFTRTENESSVSNIDRIVKQIHEPAAEKEKATETTKRISVDLPKSLHKQVWQRLLDKDLTIKDYFMELVKKDLGV